MYGHLDAVKFWTIIAQNDNYKIKVLLEVYFEPQMDINSIFQNYFLMQYPSIVKYIYIFVLLGLRYDTQFWVRATSS